MCCCYFRAAAPDILSLVDKDLVLRTKRQLCPDKCGNHARGWQGSPGQRAIHSWLLAKCPQQHICVVWCGLCRTLPCVSLMAHCSTISVREGLACAMWLVVSAWSCFISHGMNWRPSEFAGWCKTRSCDSCLRWPKRVEETRQFFGNYYKMKLWRSQECLPLL